MKFKSIHGHYADKLKEEGERIQKMCKETIDVDVSFKEATAIAALRSQNTFMSDKQLKEIIAKLRGL